jgi:endonuclease/exonuclease/phosphatase (EEP) superfamily protein YafD
MAKRLALSETDYLNSNQRMTFKGWPLDHIFSRGILIKKAEVMGDSEGSDHKPFLVEMEIQ